MKKIALISAATAASIAFTAPAAFAAPPAQSLKVSLTSTKAGTTKKPTAVGITVSTGTTSETDTPATSKHTITSAKIQLPKGIKLNYKAFAECDQPAGEVGPGTGGYCAENAPKSKIGSGSAVASVVGIDYPPKGTLTPYIGSGGRMLIRTEFTQPAVIDQPLVGKISTSGGAYAFSFDIPTQLQTPLPNADQQINDFTLKFNKMTAKSGKKKVGLVELTSCPKSKKYVFKGTFTFKEGATVNTTSEVKCK